MFKGVENLVLSKWTPQGDLLGKRTPTLSLVIRSSHLLNWKFMVRCYMNGVFWRWFRALSDPSKHAGHRKISAKKFQQMTAWHYSSLMVVPVVWWRAQHAENQWSSFRCSATKQGMPNSSRSSASVRCDSDCLSAADYQNNRPEIVRSSVNCARRTLLSLKFNLQL